MSFDSSAELQALEGTLTVALIGTSGSAVYAVNGAGLKLLGSFPGMLLSCIWCALTCLRGSV